MEESFPRGGKPSSIAPKSEERSEEEKPRHHRKKRSLEKETQQAGDDFLFGAPKKSSKHKKRKSSKSSSGVDDAGDGSSSGKHSLLPLGGGGVVLKKNTHKAALGMPSNSEPFIEALGFSKLAKGTKLLGIVREVQDDFVVFSLPNLLTGYVLRQDSGKDAPPLTRTVNVGQVMAVVIVKTVTETVKNTEGRSKNGPVTRRRIQVSMDPSAMNLRHEEPAPKFPVRGKIGALEDNGLLIDLGHGRKGFLAYDEMDENLYKIKEDEEGDEDREEEGSDDGEGTDSRTVLRVGRVDDFIVKKATKATEIVPLTLPPRNQKAKHTIPTDSMPSLQAIAPGWLVKVKVEALARNGLCVTFLGKVFRGAVELSHLGGFWIPTTRQPDGSSDWKMLFRDGSSPIRSFTARILAVDPATKMVRLTVLPHLMDLCPPPSSLLPPPGTVVENATVIRLDPGIGALLALPSSTAKAEDDEDDMEVDNDEQEGVRKPELHKPLSEKETYLEATKVRAVYVHISKAMDDTENGKTPESLFAKEFAPSTTHRLRVLSTSNLIEGVASGATAPSVIAAHVLTHADLIPGKIYRKVPVCAHLRGGAILVDFGMGIRGLVNSDHLFDQAGTSEFRSKMLKAKYAIDAKVDVRVLQSDPVAKRCLLTAKKSLLQASDIITSYSECQVGKTATGFISNIDDRGLYVTFFNNVHGRVTARSLALELGIDDHRENYSVGDVVEARVANIKKIRKGRRRSRTVDESDDEDDTDGSDTHHYFWDLSLSLRANTTDNMDAEQFVTDKQASKKVHLHAGAVLPLKSMKIVNLNPGKEKPDGSYVPGYAIVSIKSKYLVDETESSALLPYVECKLPYEHLLDEYYPEDRESAAALDALAEKLLTIGKKLNRKGLLMTDPRKSIYEYSSATGKLTVVSIRPELVEIAEKQLKETDNDETPETLTLPAPNSHLFVGANVLGYVAQIDRRHGAFVRFLDGLTGLVPKHKGGLDLEMFSTVVTRITSIDFLSRPPKILLSVSKVKKSGGKKQAHEECPIKPGDVIDSAEVESVDFFNANLKITDKKWKDLKTRARIHCTLAKCDKIDFSHEVVMSRRTKAQDITTYHPFYNWTEGKKLSDLKVVSAQIKDGIYNLELTNLQDAGGEKSELPTLSTSKEHPLPGTKVSGIVKKMAQFNGGVIVQLGLKFTGFLPALECSTDPKVLNNLSAHYPVGARIECTVIDKQEWLKLKCKAMNSFKPKAKAADLQTVYLSLMHEPPAKPTRGDLVVGHIRRSLKPIGPPALMVELRGGYLGRCCITELEEVDDWTNMPLGHASDNETHGGEAAVVSGESDMDVDDDEEEDKKDGERRPGVQDGSFPDNAYVQCRVVAGVPGRPVVEVSLRPSRIEGDLDDDEIAEPGEMAHGYVVETNKSGCFLRLSRKVDGRVILKELCDEFLPNPAASFPPGRLVVGKIKDMKQTKNKGKGKKLKESKTVVDLDMRESTVLESTKLQFSDIELYSKHKGTVTRVESYGVFVRLENSSVSGLAHKSECSDKYIKNLQDLYDPGDLVKVLVIKKDEEEKRIGFSMKASHFADDEDSDEESIPEEMSDDSDDDGDKAVVVPADGGADDDELDSDDEDYASKLAEKLQGKSRGKNKETGDEPKPSNSSESSSSDSDSEESKDDGEEDDNDNKAKEAKHSSSGGMDTDVGFDWDASSSVLAKKKTLEPDSDEDGESEDGDDALASSTSHHKSRKKQAQKRREEQEIFRRETALADGTADENPETAADFERLISGDPNSSELWIRYMAFHLSLADVPSARSIAERAFARIEFREEREKLNVWSALLTLELKYGSSSSLQKTIDRACQQNNPKQVYLRVCEMLEKEVNMSSPDSIVQADEMFAKMCKKFRSKKKVWIAYLQYLLKAGRHKEAHDLLARAFKSLPEYKHVETMSKFAQLEFEFGSPERARTVFDGILLKNPKRLDLVFVYVDKEIKHGSVEMARSLFQKIANPPGDNSPKSKLTDKQMKSMFKKWYRIEEEHGTPESQDNVKEAAKAYVTRTSAS